MGKSSLLWENLIPELKESVSTLGTPSVVFIHVGSSDLGNKPYQKLKSHVKSDLSLLSKSYPNTAFIWSPILPRSHWIHNNMEDYRKEFNSDISICAEECGFQVASLSLVEEMTLENYRRKFDRDSYSLDYICEVLNTYIKRAVEKEIKMKGAV